MHVRLALIVTVAGCSATPELSTSEAEVIGCHPLICGTNSPDIDFSGFHELHKYGQENAEGIAIIGFRKAGLDYQLHVENGELFGTRRGSPDIAHHGLIGAEILVQRYRTDTFAIRVFDVSTVPYFVPPAGTVETYRLEYARYEGGVAPDNWVNLCGGFWAPDDNVQSPDGQPVNVETLGQRAGDSILYDLDRVDLTRKRMNDRPDSSWFNIGCAGHTLSKLHLTRNTISSQGAAHAGLWNERQATLKMLVADYCGDGTAFTVAGQRINWQGGGMSYFSAPLALEARWNENGAFCLDTPRMVRATTAAGAAMFPDIEAAIAAQCARPPACSDSDPFSMTKSLRVSSLR